MRLSLHEMVLWYHQHMDRIYLDNAATSFPKAPGTAEAVYDYLKRDAVNRETFDAACSASSGAIVGSRFVTLLDEYRGDASQAIERLKEALGKE